MATVGEIAIVVGADVGPMVRELGKGKGALNDFGNAGSKIGGILGSAMGRVAIGVGAAATALVAMTRASMANIDALSKQARALGISVSSFQSMAMVAEEAGVQSDQLSKILIKMQDNIASLGAGTKAQKDQFAALGVSMSDLVGLGADEQFALIAEKINNIGDPSKRTAAALNVFGKSGADAITMLDGYGGALSAAAEFQRDFGLAVTDEQAQGIEAANDAVGRLGMAFGGLGNQLAVVVAPALEATANGLANLIAGLVGAEDQTIQFFKTASNYKAVMEEFGSVEAAAALAGGWTELERILQQSNAKEVLAEIAASYDTLLDVSGRVTGEMARDIYMLADEYPILSEAIGNMAARVEELGGLLQAALDAGDVEAAQLYSEQLRIAVENLDRAVIGADALSSLDLSGSVSWAGTLAAAFGNVAAAAWEAVEAASAVPGAVVDYGAMGDDERGGQRDQTRSGGEFKRDAAIAGRKGGGGGGGGGGSGGGTDAFAARIEALVGSLQTEREIIAAWYEESLATLQTATEAELAALGGKHEAIERLEEEHQSRLSAIKEMGNQWGVQAALSGGAEILGALGQNNKKALKLSKAFAAAEALVSTYQGAAAELKKGTFGFASAAAVIAKGIGFIAAIKGATEGGGGGGGGGGRGAAAPAAAPQQPGQTFNLNFQNDPFGISERFGRQFATQMNEAARNGMNLRFTVGGAA